MHRTEGFAPHWASAPGDTISEALATRGLSLTQFSGALRLDEQTAQGLLTGDTPITIGVARRMAACIGGTPAFWVSRDTQYRDDLAWQAAADWSQRLPTDEMVRLGWLPQTDDWQQEIEACLDFFDVRDTHEWREVHGTRVVAARFRRSATLPGVTEAVAAWLHKGVSEVADESTASWAPNAFAEAMPHFRALTKSRDPQHFIPRLKTMAAALGVRVAVVQAPRGCPVSGAAFSPEPGRPVIILSGRYRSDDHFWFTFFHEAGHLILHDSTVAFVDDLSVDATAQTPQEAEADQFAQTALIPDVLLIEARNAVRLDAREVVLLAARARVSPGVLLGQLQHAGILEFDRLNFLKRRYKWSNSSLESA